MKLELIELAQCLELPANTIERWIRQGRMPIRKTGTVCIFKKAVLEKWAVKHNIKFTPPSREETEPETAEKTTADLTNSLTAAMRHGGLHRISGETIEDVLKTAAENIPALSISEKAILFDKLLEREQLTSTGIGKGVAIPHPRTPMEGDNRLPVVATFFLNKGIDFGAIDDRPVTVLFVIICPSVQSHLHLLSMISFCVRDNAFVEFLNTNPEPEAFFKKISEIENNLEK